MCLLIVLSLFIFGHGIRASDIILTGQNLTDGNTLVSADDRGLFTLRFYSPPSSGSGEPPTTKRYLVISFSFSNETDSICWVANRDNPLNDTSGVLVLTPLGLELRDGSNNSVWSSGSSSASATGARLLPSGNLVVQGGPDNKKALWQSFDQPCNTLLAGMKIGTWSGNEWYLSSWIAANDPGTGSYRYMTEPGGGGGSTPENVLRDGNGTKKYRTGPWNGERFDGVPEMASYSSNFTYQIRTSEDGEVTYSYSAKPGAAYSQLRLSEAGLVQRLVWDASNQKWNQFLKEPRDDCDDYAHCGPFALCDSNAPSSSLCRCFNGFVPVSPRDWKLREYSGGCRQNFSLDCSSNQSRGSTDGFYVVSLVKLPDTENASVDLAASLDDCRVRCLANCSCVAYAAANVTGVRGCITWPNSFADLRLIDGGQDLFIRMPISLIPDGGNNKKKFPLAIVLGSAGAVVFLIIGAITIYGILKWRNILRRRRRNALRPANNPSSSSTSASPVSIAYQTLQATGSFIPENFVGHGRFGKVYKCQLPDAERTRIELPVGAMVALKVLNRSPESMKSYDRELSTMSRLSHNNLVGLLAYSNDNEAAAAEVVVLVYEYMQKGSLDRYLFDNNNRAELSWKQRLQVITSIAEGIFYLHVGCGKSIIHRDLKPANILLADDWTPKIADFGLAKHVTDMKAFHTPTGPHGYIAPECVSGKPTSHKSDIYSFGVLLLETISGQQNGYMQSLLPHTWNIWNSNEGHALKELLDPGVPEEDELSTKLQRCIQIGLLCVQGSPDRRPSISEVVDMLKTDCPLPRPQRPILREDGQTSNTMQSDDTRPQLELAATQPSTSQQQ